MDIYDQWQSELKTRRKLVWDIIQEAKCDILLIYSSREYPESFRYLTNFVPVLGDMWAIQTGDDQLTCLLNFHWELNEARQVSGLTDWHGYFDPYPFLQERISSLKPSRLAVLGLDHIPWKVVQWISNTLGAELVPVDEQVNRLRRVKRPLEIQMLREAMRITKLAFSEIQPLLQPGISEIEIMAEVLHIFNKNGCEPSFYPGVIGGTDADSAVIARKPRPRLLEKGDTVMIDIGAAYQGYMADVTRTFFLGKPTALQLHVMDTVQRAHDAVIKLCRPGTPCLLLHQTAQSIIESAGYTLDHRIGHGFGLGTSFEWPNLIAETAELEPGHTIAIEPGIYRIGAGAIKIEDCILITETGCDLMSG